MEVRPGGQWFLQDPRGAKLGPYSSAEIVNWFDALQVAEGAGEGWRDLRGALAAMGGDAPAKAAKQGKEAEKSSREKGVKDKTKDKQKEPEKNPATKAGTVAPPTPADPAGEKGPVRMEKVTGKTVTGKGSLAPAEADVSAKLTGGTKGVAASEVSKSKDEVTTVAEASSAKAEGVPIRSVAATNSAKPAVPAPKPDLASAPAPARVGAPAVTESPALSEAKSEAPTPTPASALVPTTGPEPAPTAAPKSSEAPSKNSAESPASGAAAEPAESKATTAPAPEKSLPNRDPAPSKKEVSEWLFWGKGAEGDEVPLWRYVDNNGEVQGPFGPQQMVLWHEKKFFQGSLLMLGCSGKLSPPNLPPTSSYRPFGELLREASESFGRKSLG